jgi:hypothetical protein
MSAAPYTRSVGKPLSAALATARFGRASTSRSGSRIHDKNQEGEEFSQRDVKNEGTSGDVYENKG